MKAADRRPFTYVNMDSHTLVKIALFAVVGRKPVPMRARLPKLPRNGLRRFVSFVISAVADLS
jgi:hypothetical protein